MYKLCLGCWRSRSELKFELHPSGNRRNLCYDCRNSGVCEPKTTYNREQNSKPLSERNKFCITCLQEKNISSCFPEKGFTETGKKRYGSECSNCRNKTFRTPEYRAKASVWRKREGLSEYMVNYNRAYIQSKEGKARKRKAHLKRKSMKKNQENFMSPTFSQELLEMCNNICQKCGSKEDLQYDHIIPVSWGRICDWSLLNAQILCGTCNNNKSDSFSYDYRDMSIAIPGEDDSCDIDIFAML